MKRRTSALAVVNDRALHQAEQRTAVHRREFLRLLGVAGAALAANACIPAPTTRAGAPALCAEHDAIGDTPTDEALDLPHLGGAPNTPEGRAVAAFVDTVVPGRHRDPTGAPGGIDVGAPALFFDPAFPAERFLGAFILLANGYARDLFSADTFAQLTPEERDTVIEQASADIPEIQFAIQLAKVASLATPGYACHLGYPGANDGYVNDDDFSFGDAPLTTEITSDGNLP